MDLYFKQLKDGVELPQKATNGSRGYDLVATSERIDLEGRYIEYGTSLAVEIPENFSGLLLPRSSVSSKDIILSNGLGLIDSDFRGEIKLRFKNLLPAGARKYKVGDKIGQLVVVHTPELNCKFRSELSVTERGSGGFGSSDKKEKEV